MLGRCIHARVHVVRHHLLRMGRLESFGESARAVVGVPIEASANRRALNDFEPERGDVGHIERQACKLLLVRQAEFMGLLQAIAGIAAGIREGYDIAPEFWA